jgi:hypothetical protein
MQKLKLFEINCDHSKIVTVIGHLFFAVYIILSGLYYLERAVAFDGAFYCYKIIHYRSLNIENGRWGIAYTQWLPFLGLLAKCSLKTFLVLYSLSFALWNYVFFIVLIKFYKNFKIGLAYLLTLVLFYRYSFFYPVSEIHSTIGPVFLALAAATNLISSVNENATAKIYRYLFLLILTVYWAANIHILCLVPLCYFFVYLIIDKKSNLKNNWLVYAGFGICIFYLFYKVLSIPKDSYEGSKIIGLSEFKLVLTNPNSLDSFYFLKSFFSNHFVLNLVFLACTLLFLVYSKSYLKPLLILSSFLGIIVLNLAYYTQNNAPLNYQNYYCYLGVIMALPLVNDFLSKLTKPILIAACVILLTFNLYKIIKSGLIYSDRIKYIERTVENLRQFKESKFVACAWNFDWSVVWGDWDFPFESLLISSLKGPDASISFYSAVNTSQFDFCTTKDPKCFIGITFLPQWWRTNSDFVKNDYFDLKPGFYKKVNSRQDYLFDDASFKAKNIEIATKDNYILLRNTRRQIDVIIKNNYTIPFCSSITEEKTIWLSYHIFSKEGNLLVSEGDRSVLEMDIPANSSIKNGLSLNLKDLARGEYILEIDLVHEGKRWFGINKRTLLKIY